MRGKKNRLLNRSMRSLFYVLLGMMCVVCMDVYVYAKIDFVSQASGIVIKPAYSELSLRNVDKVTGFGEFSIIKSVGYQTAGNWPEQYYDDVLISQEGSEDPATMLVYSNSNAIVNLKSDVSALSSEFDSAVTIYDTHQIYGSAGNNMNTSEENLVYFKDGFTLFGSWGLTLNTPIPATGKIDLNDETITLANDFYLGSNAYLTNSGAIDGQGYSLVLSCSLVIPENKTLRFISDTIVNGHGTTLFLEPGASLAVSNNVTVTLKNIRIKNTANTENNPMISLGQTGEGWLALQDVELDLADDFYLNNNGRVFIHGDVVVSGKSSLIYELNNPSYIADGATWGFDPGTTFYYKPPVADTGLIRMQSDTSSLYLDGATLKTTYTGLRLTKGSLYFDNKVTLSTAIYIEPDPSWDISMVTQKNITSYPGLSQIGSSSWDPHYNWLAISDASSGVVAIFSFDGTTLTYLTQITVPYDVQAIAWSKNPAIPVLAVVGNDVRTYSFDGVTLSFINSDVTPPWGDGLALAFDQVGHYLAVSTYDDSFPLIIWKSIKIYEILLDGSLSLVTADDVLDPSLDPVHALAWNSTGDRLLSGDGDGGIERWSFDGFTLSSLGTVSTPFSDIRSIVFSPNYAYIAVGGRSATQFRIYNSALSLITNQTFVSSDVYSIAWNTTNNRLFVGGNSSTVAIYDFDGANITQLDTEIFGGSVRTIQSLPAWDYFSVGGATSNIDVYEILYTPPAPPPPLTFENGLIFGDSSQLNSNLDVHVLGGAQVNIVGVVYDDSL